MSTDPVRAEVDAFLSARPYYDRAHVQEIAERREVQHIPFCPECADWHDVTEEHSLIN